VYATDGENRNHHSQFYAQYVAEAAQEYADAWRTFHALNEARSRSDGEGGRDFEIIIVRSAPPCAKNSSG